MHSMPCSANQTAAALGLVDVQRSEGTAEKVESLVDFAYEMHGHDPIGLDPEVGVAIALRDALAADLQHPPETRA